MRIPLYFASMALALLAPLEISGRVIRVPTDQPTIQEGLDNASYGDTVLVATGSYGENIIWPATQGLHLVGEYGQDSVTIDGGGAARVITMNAVLTTETRISGFTITNGTDSLGGGIYCYQSSPTIEHCCIVSNRASNGFGGGVYCEQASPVIRQSVIANNAADRIGGGIFAKSSSTPLVNYNHLYGNRPYYGVYNADASITIDATNNLWGVLAQEFGPFDPSKGPPDYNALWPNEMISDYVSYRPWLTEPGVLEEERLSLFGASKAPTLAILPNPFTDVARIRYTLFAKSSVALKVYDAAGRLVSVLINEDREVGSHSVIWEGKDESGADVSSGVYFCRLRAGDFQSTRKMVVID